MNFNSLEFIFVFLPVTLAVFYLAPLRLRTAVLTVASVLFYGMAGKAALLVFVLAIIWTYFAAFFVERTRASWVIWVSASVPLSILFLFKYLGFVVDNFDPTGQGRDAFQLILAVSLPAGISFYTFQSVAYLIDVRDGTVRAERNFLRMAAFISFFAQLIAGPIMRYRELRDQLARISSERIVPNLSSAIKYFAFGLFYKIIFADVLRGLMEQYQIGGKGGSLDALYSVLAYSFVIFYDFWGYSLMAIGLGLMFGIKLPRNFLEPYLSVSPREFWRRWHVTLSYWLKDYVYIRLGGNKAYILNISIVFIACGIWHGAGWNFIVWGAYHAVLVAGYHLVRPAWDRLPRIVGIVLTFSLVTLGWPLFYNSLPSYLVTMREIFYFNAPSGPLLFGPFAWAYLGLVAFWCFGMREDRWLFNENRVRLLDSHVLHGVLFSLSIMFIEFSQNFIYFSF